MDGSQANAMNSTPSWNRYTTTTTPGSASQPSLTHSASSSDSTFDGFSSSNHDRNNSTDAGYIVSMHSSSATFTNFGGVESHKINSSSPGVATDTRSTTVTSPATPHTSASPDTRRESQRPRSEARLDQILAEAQDAAPRSFATTIDRLAPL